MKRLRPFSLCRIDHQHASYDSADLLITLPLRLCESWLEMRAPHHKVSPDNFTHSQMSISAAHGLLDVLIPQNWESEPVFEAIQ